MEDKKKKTKKTAPQKNEKQKQSETKDLTKSPLSKLEELFSDDDPKKPEEEPVDPEALARGDNPMTVVSHLDELRSRLLIVLVLFLVLTCVAFNYSDYLLDFISKPLLKTGNKLNLLTLTEAFLIKIKISAAVALLILIPVIIFHIWRFIVPAIGKSGRFYSRITIISSILLFYAGVVSVFLMLPATVKIMLSFATSNMQITIKAEEYLHLILFLSLVMGILFEFPIVVLITTRIGLITPQFLVRKRKYAIVIIWIIAAIITPQPDPLSQSMVAVPLMLLYEISIWISRMVLLKKKKREIMAR